MLFTMMTSPVGPAFGSSEIPRLPLTVRARPPDAHPSTTDSGGTTALERPLTPMYLAHYGFEQEPFNITPDSHFLFPSQRHREAMAAMVYGIEHRKGFIALTGEIGSGKTTICRALLKQLKENIKVALILNPQLSDHELLQAINVEFGLPHASSSKRELLAVLNEFLLDEYADGRNCVLIIDESQRLSPDTLEQIRLISNLELEHTKLIQIALVGQPELDDILRLPQLEQLNQRITVRCHIGPLNLDEMTEYINHRLGVANPDHKVVFHKKALRAIYEYTGGVPRRINLVCDRALLITFVGGGFEVSEANARKAIAEVEGPRPNRKRRGASGNVNVQRISGSGNPLPAMRDTPTPEPHAAPARGDSRLGWAVVVAALVIAAAILYVGLGGSRTSTVQVASDPRRPIGVPPRPMPTATPAPTPTPVVEVAVAATPTPAPSATAPAEPLLVVAAATPEATPPPAPTPTPAPVEVAAAPPIPGAATKFTLLAGAAPTPAPDIVDGATTDTLELAMVSPTPTPLPGAPDQSWSYDADEIVRVARPELTYAAAVLTWVARTRGERLPDDELARLRSLDAATIGKYRLTSGQPPLYLREAQVPGSLAVLRPEVLPALVQVDRRTTEVGPWAVLLKFDEQTATLADPIRGLVEMPSPALDGKLATVVIPFADAEGLTNLSPRDTGERVRALQRRLARLGFLDAEPTGVFDAGTERAVRRYRDAKQLPGTPSIDPLLALALTSEQL